MHRRWALVRDLPVFREQRLPNAVYFTDDSAAGLSIQIENIIRLAEERLPKHVNLLNWPDCVERLIEEIGFAAPLAQDKPIKVALS
jgi:hypothetical protein